MKKLFILFALLCGAVCFAETGYRNFEWGEKIDTSDFKKVENPIFSNKEGGSYLFSTETVLLGRKNELFYLILPEKNIYMGAGYFLSPEETSKLIRKYKNLILQKKITFDFLNYFLKDSYKDITFKNEKELNTAILFELYRYAFVVENREGLENLDIFNYDYFIENYEIPENEKDIIKKRTDKPGEILIYDYNDDTRVYIFDRITNDKTVVVYVPHEQDY